jgi:hypothetical protein
MITCKSCGSLVDKSPMRGTQMQLYNAVICESCKKVECMSCKQSKGPLNAPCSSCGGKVSPAFEHLVK